MTMGLPSIADVLRLGPVIPVLTVDNAVSAQPIAEALVAGGIRVMEVTLRTPSALTVISEMTKVEGAVVGAGTVLHERQIDAAAEAGARFIVSPGLTDTVAAAARTAALPFLPGVATASEIMRALDLGLTHFKFFPAEASGGVSALKAFAGPFADVSFCPTGGIDAAKAPAYLALAQVPCVGGTWLVPKGASDLAAITERARQACALASPKPTETLT